MRIAIFSDTFYPKIDGIVTALMNSISFLSKKGHKIVVFCPSYGKGDEHDFGKGVKVYRFFSIPLLTYKEVKLVFINRGKVMKVLEGVKPDVIHLHTPGFVCAAGIMAAKKLKVPLIGTYHTLVSEQMNYLSPFSILGINWLLVKLRLKSMSTLDFLKKEDSKSILKRLGWWISFKIYNKCDVLAAPSDAIRRLLVEKKAKGRKIFLSNGIDLKKFTPKKHYGDGNGLKLLHVGRVSYEKGIDVVIKAVGLTIKRSKEKITLDIAGGGPALESLKELVRKMGLEGNIHLLGRVSDERLKEMYKECDLFVTASAMETQGIVVLEAMATGLPVIGVRKYAVPDLVKDCYNGFLAEPYDDGDFSKAILRMLKDKARIRHYGKNALETARQHELNKCLSKLEKTYKGMVKN